MSTVHQLSVEATLTHRHSQSQLAMQDIKGSDIFSNDSSGTGHAAGAVPGLSDAKKKALYSTSVFGQDNPAAAPQVQLDLSSYLVIVKHILLSEKVC